MMTMPRFANDESLLIQAQNGDSEAVELYLSAFVPFLNTIAKRFLIQCYPRRNFVRPGISD